MTVKHLEIKALVVAAATACTLFLGLSDSRAERYSDEVSLLELSDSIADLSATASRATHVCAAHPALRLPRTAWTTQRTA